MLKVNGWRRPRPRQTANGQDKHQQPKTRGGPEDPGCVQRFYAPLVAEKMLMSDCITVTCGTLVSSICCLVEAGGFKYCLLNLSGLSLVLG